MLDNMKICRYAIGNNQHARRVFVPENPGIIALTSGVAKFFLRNRNFVTAEGDVFFADPSYLPRIGYLALSSSGAEFAWISLGAQPTSLIPDFSACEPYRPRRSTEITSFIRTLLAIDNCNPGIAECRTVEQCLSQALLEISMSDKDVEEVSETTSERIKPVLDYMREHFDEHISLDTLANLAGYSRYHFVRFFAKVVGDTPHRYLTSLRTEVAAQWLDAGTDATVAFIGRMCGFPNPTSFARAFRQYAGVTPSEYRARHNGIT